jgi:cobyrinic acid a,c-diamide synthase
MNGNPEVGGSAAVGASPERACLPPRLVVAGTHSGAGKTTVATGLMAALAATGHTVASAKVGPDFIDPGYHTLATGRPGHNLDPWLQGADAQQALAARAARNADLLVVEGVMGLFDGAATPVRPDGELDLDGELEPGGERDRSGGRDRRARGAAPDGARDEGHLSLPVASTAEVAALLEAPVLLVVDARGLSGSVAALVQGYARFHPAVQVAGVVLNRVGSDTHEALLREALDGTGVAVLGALRRDDAWRWRERHLGLVPVVEDAARLRRAVERLGRAVAASCDLDAIVRLARAAPATTVRHVLPATEPVARVRIALAAGPAFSFAYPENLERLAEAGGTLVPFDPLTDEALPADVGGLYAGGGFPEVFAGTLGANEPLLAALRARCGRDLVTWAECGGALWLSRSLDGTPMARVLPADAHMTDRLHLGYRHAALRSDGPLGPAGTRLRGHEHHYSVLEPGGDALSLAGRLGQGRDGFAGPGLLATYLHVHLGADPEPARRFVAAVARQRLRPA